MFYLYLREGKRIVNKRIMAIIGLLIVFGGNAYAENMVGKSLEWLTDESSAIGIYRVLNVTTDKTGEIYSSELHRDTTLKGICPDTAKDEYFKSMRWPLVRKDAVITGDRFLVFWIGDTNKSVHETINLTTPLKTGFRHIAADADQNLLGDADAILKVVKGRMKAMPKPQIISAEGLALKDYWVEVRVGSDLWQALYGGSMCYLLVPQDIKEK